MAPSMGAEDFAYMLEKIPGSYIWLGAGEGKSGCMLHNSKYDFNDDILPLGIAYWEQLVKSEMPLDNIDRLVLNLLIYMFHEKYFISNYSSYFYCDINNNICN